LCKFIIVQREVIDLREVILMLSREVTTVW